MTTEEILNGMRYRYQTNKVTQLAYGNHYFSSEEYQKIIDEIQKWPIRVALGERPSAMEKMLFNVLMKEIS